LTYVKFRTKCGKLWDFHAPRAAAGRISFSAPESLITRASGAAFPSDRDTIDQIEQGLVAAGYQPLAGRLVEAGCDHQLNRAAEGTPPAFIRTPSW
jgi:hypothetical protein